MRQLRFPRTAVLLALPGLRFLGNLFAAPHRREGIAGMSGEEIA
jgi:hypothetical protein